MFANRLLKMQRHTGKWARRQGISCYRLYDADLPEFPLAVDVYEDILHVAEYERNHNLTPEQHIEWLESALQTLSETLEVHPDSIFLKYRRPQKGLSQYERFNRQGAEFIVRENGLRFIINASDYLDTGLFLDHRNTRQMVRSAAAGKKVLNLFAYTGAFSVYAAAGSASETLTIDMSNTYLQWARRNLQINGFDRPEHRLLQADVLQWLRQPVQETFDIIVLDPPTFSNSKRMFDTLDVQRDHVPLIQQTMRRLNPGGTLYFSTNYRKFKLDTAALSNLNPQDISAQTVPNDFRNKKIHQCYRM